MAIVYIKLGPNAQTFTDRQLGIYLSKTNAAEVDSSLTEAGGRLRNFILTGFLVETSKLEYDNLKLQTENARNIPLNVIPIEDTRVASPIETILNVPPIALVNGIRYLVGPNPLGSWTNYKDYVAEWNGNNWEFIKPINGMSLPVYAAGTAITYIGTYPSGYWDIPNESLLLETIPVTNITDQEYTLKLFNQEKKERVDADKALAEALSKISNKSSATEITVVDKENLFSNNNVELVLWELGTWNTANSKSIEELSALIKEIGERIPTEIPARTVPRLTVSDGDGADSEIIPGDTHIKIISDVQAKLFKAEQPGLPDVEDISWVEKYTFSSEIPRSLPISVSGEAEYVLDWDDAKKLIYGEFGHFEVWQSGGGNYSKQEIPISMTMVDDAATSYTFTLDEIDTLIFII